MSTRWTGWDLRPGSQALEKLAKLRRKIGYPSRWRDYSGLVIRRDDLVGNVIRSNEWEFAYQLGKLGKPVDREEWVTDAADHQRLLPSRSQRDRLSGRLSAAADL